MKAVEPRAAIKKRMMEEAIKLWGYQEGELGMEHFDPLVELLIGSCAAELEKIAHELQTSRSRVAERLVQVMAPDVAAGVRPAHTILQARPADPIQFTHAHHQFYKKSTREEGGQEIFFTPIGSFKIFDGQIAYSASRNKVFQYTDQSSRRLLLSDSSQDLFPGGTYWLGLSLNEAIDFPEGMSIYFDFPNLPTVSDYYRLLALSRIWIGDLELAISPGLDSAPMEPGQTYLEEEDARQRFNKHILQYYNRQFLTLHAPKQGSLLQLANSKRKYPREFEDLFSAEELKAFKTQIIWLKLQLPEAIPTTALEQLQCSINCFPAINRQFHEEQYKLNPELNIITLNTARPFLYLEQVEDSNGQALRPTYMRRLAEFEKGSYLLRRQGVRKFDERDAAEMVHNLIDQLRNESAAFAAISNGLLQHQLLELNQLLARLEKGTKKEEQTHSAAPSLFLRPDGQPQGIWIQYWSTDAALANRIPAGTLLEAVDTSNYQQAQIRLISTTIGGRNQLNATERISAYREALSTRGRIVTAEDVRALCMAWLGPQIASKIEVRMGVTIGTLPNEGLTRSIEVLIHSTNRESPGKQEWEALCTQLEVELRTRSQGIFPYIIRVLQN